MIDARGRYYGEWFKLPGIAVKGTAKASTSYELAVADGLQHHHQHHHDHTDGIAINITIVILSRINNGGNSDGYIRWSWRCGHGHGMVMLKPADSCQLVEC